MVASFLQDDLIKELNVIFEDFNLNDSHGNRRRINIYSQSLPIPETEEIEDIPIEQLEEGLADEKTMVDPHPYILVKVSEGVIENLEAKQEVDIVLLFGIYDSSYQKNGHKDILNMIQKIYERFAKNPILAQTYKIKYPINWALQDDNQEGDTFPYYFGGMYLLWETAAIKREDKYA